MSHSHFSQQERDRISILLKNGHSHREIGSALGKHHSSVSREVERNSVGGVYHPNKAEHKAYVRRYNSKYQCMKIRENGWLEEYIRAGLRKYWTPEQIAGRLRKKYGGKIISFRSIYKYVDTQHGEEFRQYLPYNRNSRKIRKNRKQQNTILKNRVFIDKRPAFINKRLRYGDLEGDTLGVPRTSRETIVGLVDRKSRYLLAKKIARFAQATGSFKELSTLLSVQSYTLDNGVENARYSDLELPVYFCHAYSAWEKPTIENTFQRLRRFIPKKKRLDDYSDGQIFAIVDVMNNTPRKCIHYSTPQELFDKYQRKTINTGVAFEG